jgi:hypothetical protein
MGERQTSAAKELLREFPARRSGYRSIVEAFGFELRRTSGSHHVFAHRDVRALLNLQDVKGQAKPYHVRSSSGWSSADSDPHLEMGVGAEPPLDLLDAATHCHRRAHRPQGVVLVHDRHAEDRHHFVADELVNDAAVCLDDGRGTVEELPHDVA